MATHFPFTAIIGQEAMQTALLLCAVDPSIGGVLIRGQKGTAKSTAARSLATVLPPIEAVSGCPFHCDPASPESLHEDCRRQMETGHALPKAMIPTPFVDLPLSATEDRLVGSLHLEQTLSSGQRQFEPGLFASAHRGILYVDEVNLLPDHLVDLLLDTASSGINLVEREGLQFRHSARFLLVGTMNPEEGELRPQFLDRFGLCVTIDSLDDVTLRSSIVNRRLSFDSNPDKMLGVYAEREEILRTQVTRARQTLDDIVIPEEIINRAAVIANHAKAQGHRAELTLVRAARALTALLDRNCVSEHELSEVAGFALAHRIPGQSVLSQTKLTEMICALLEEQGAKPSLSGDKIGPVDDVELMENMDFPGSAAAGSMLFTYLKKKLTTASFAPMNHST